MEFSIKSGNPEKQRSDCLVVGVFDGGKLSPSAAQLDAVSEQAITAVIKTGDMSGQLATTVLMHHAAGTAAKRILLVGLGKESELAAAQYLKAVRASVKGLPKAVKDAAVMLTELAVSGMTLNEKVAQIAEVFLDATYQVNSLKSKKPETAALKKVQVLVDAKEASAAKLALKQNRPSS